MNKGPKEMHDAIVKTAYHHACEHGLQALNIRTVAKLSSVSVGTIYNYFPDKAALATEVIKKFWTDIAFSEDTKTCLSYTQGENLVSFCKRIEQTMSHALAQFRTNWLGEVSALDARTRQKGREAENICFQHIYESIEKVIKADPHINQTVLESVGPRALAHFIWDTIYQTLRTKEFDRRHNDETKQSCKVFFLLLEQALY